jgi:hypothetical protein
MDIDDIRQRLNGPFVPFKIRTSDGRTFPVPHREFAYVTPTGNKVVVATQKGTLNVLQAFHIVSVEEAGSLPAG